MYDREWDEFYLTCPKWSEVWKSTHVGDDWPKEYKISGGKLLFEEKLCIPTSLQKQFIREYHSFVGHVGAPRLWKHLSNHFVFGDEKEAKDFVHQVMGECETCQACQRTTSLNGMVEYTLVPPRIMTSVALDLFHMPEVTSEGTNMTQYFCVWIGILAGLSLSLA